MISFIVPFFNVSKYLKNCIDSILNQSYTNFELILINDGSNDESLDIALSFLNDKKVFLIDKLNGGQSTARNVGIEFIQNSKLRNLLKKEALSGIKKKKNNYIEINTKSIFQIFNKEFLSDNLRNCDDDYIIFIDSDDYIALNSLERSIHFIKMNIDIIIWRQLFIYDGVRPRNFIKWHYHKEEIKNCKDTLCAIKKDEQFVFCVGGLIKVKSLGNLRMIEGIISEDNHFGIKIFYQSHKYVFLSDMLYFYRIRLNSVCGYGNSVSSFLESDNSYSHLFKDHNVAKNYMLCYSNIITSYFLFYDDDFLEPYKSKFALTYFQCGLEYRLYHDALNAKSYVIKLKPLFDQSGMRAKILYYSPTLFKIIIAIKYKKYIPNFLRLPWNKN